MTPPTDKPHAEFDVYAANYEAGMENPLRRCVGGDAESFIKLKVDWLLRRLQGTSSLSHASANMRLLDYGCGAGTMLSLLGRHGFSGTLAGCDVSQEMLAEARRRWSSGSCPDLRLIEHERAPFDAGQFDVVVLSSVLHHVPVPGRNAVYADATRVLAPGGRICIFEHNPYNPLTCWVVRHTPIDKNAVLLKPCEVRTGLRDLGLSRLQTRYIMFFPPRWELFRPLDAALCWLPCGAQYVVSARKGAR